MMQLKLIGLGVAAVVLATLGLGSCTTIETGNVGVKSSFGQIDLDEVPAGFTFKAPMFTSINNYNVREIPLDLQNLTPKAKDNLSLKDMDVSIFYEVNPARVADVVAEFKGQTPWDSENGVYLPGQGIVERFSREAVYDVVSRLESLTIHQRRELLVGDVKNQLQLKLDKISPSTFTITNVVIRAITTDPSIEASIRNAVKAQKMLEQMEVQTEIAKKQAEVAVTKAEGEAQANRALAASLTPELLRKQQNDVMLAFAESGNASTIVLPSNATPLVNIK
jgi:regulator of protease activity HflC (stomatin/prohibitin superfamily)